MDIRLLKYDLTDRDVVEFVFRLLNNHLFLPDSWSDYSRLVAEIDRRFSSGNDVFWGIYKGDKLGGVAIFSLIEAGFEGELYFWLWDKAVFGKNLIRWLDKESLAFIRYYNLKRLVSRTADPRVGRILKLCKFKLEGTFKNGYKHHKKLYMLYQYRRLGG